MWKPDAEPQYDLHEQTIAADVVLYMFDEPLIFTSKLPPSNYLFVKFDEEKNFSRYIASTITSKPLEYLQEGLLSVRGALEYGSAVIIDLSLELRVIKHWAVDIADIPEHCLPHRGVGLFPSTDWVPDTLEQADAFFAARFSGNILGEKSIKFQTFRQLIDGFYDCVRGALAPDGLGGARSATFDFNIAEPSFGSLVLSITEPNFNLSKVRKNLKDNTLNFEDVSNKVSAQRIEFFNDVKEIVADAEIGEIELEKAQKFLYLLNIIEDVIPGGDSPFSKIEFSAGFDGERDYVAIGEAAGARMRKARDEALRIKKDTFGKIEIINSSSKTFVIRPGALSSNNRRFVPSILERKITCSVSNDIFKELDKDERFRQGAIIKLAGEYQKRTARDFINVAGMPLIISAPLQEG